MHDSGLDIFLAWSRMLFPFDGIRTVVEVGARDCVETVAFHRLLPEATVYAFECNPDTLPVCRRNSDGIASIELIEKAVSNTVGRSKFYPIDRVKMGDRWNPGASSLYLVSKRHPEAMAQNEIVVDCTTLKAFMEERALQTIDLLWMDIQGAELMALEGLGDAIGSVGLMHLEVEFQEIYKDQPLFHDVKAYLNRHGFLLIASTYLCSSYGNAIFANKQLLHNRLGIDWDKLDNKVETLMKMYAE